jgi:hypothetical protein
MAARTLHVALELRLFTHLAPGAQTLVQVAQALGLAERAAGRLLYACAALGLVQATGVVFRNTPLTQKYLVEGQPTFIGSYLHMFDALGYHRWQQMGAALRHNGPVDDISHPYRYLADDAEDAATFSAAQHAGSRSLGQPWHAGSISHPLRLLDLGGGSERIQWKSSAVIHTCVPSFRLPQVAAWQRPSCVRGAHGPVHIVGGDYEHEALPPGPDVVLWSGNLHASSPESCRRVLTRLHALLPPGGMVLIHDYMLDDTRSGPLIPALLALHLTLVSEHGQVYSGAELHDLLAQAGFKEVRIEPFLTGHSSLVMARRG